MTSREAYEAWWSLPPGAWMRRRELDPHDLAFEAWQAATAAERERTAKIAETLGVHPALNVYAGGPEWYKHGQEIAAAIRASQASPTSTNPPSPAGGHTST